MVLNNVKLQMRVQKVHNFTQIKVQSAMKMNSWYQIFVAINSNYINSLDMDFLGNTADMCTYVTHIFYGNISFNFLYPTTTRNTYFVHFNHYIH